MWRVPEPWSQHLHPRASCLCRALPAPCPRPASTLPAPSLHPARALLTPCVLQEFPLTSLEQTRRSWAAHAFFTFHVSGCGNPMYLKTQLCKRCVEADNHMFEVKCCHFWARGSSQGS